jgi:arabinogalactan oligomer/maltooligosaccharide transport system substrate-binding protein
MSDQKMKTFVSLYRKFLILVFISAVLINCSVPPDDPPASIDLNTEPASETSVPEPTPSPVEITLPSTTPTLDSPDEFPGSETQEVSLSGSLTIWHGNFGDEIETILQELESKNPEFKISVTQLATSELERDFLIDSLNGEGPDLVIARSDQLPLWVNNGIVHRLSEPDMGDIDSFYQNSVEAMSNNGGVYGYPLSVETNLFFYDRQKFENPPQTIQEIEEFVNSGTSLTNIVSSYHLFGWSGAFAGELFNEDFQCVADQTGWLDAVQYLVNLRNIGVSFSQQESDASTSFISGGTDSILNGSWAIPEYRSELGERLGIVRMPGGPGGSANPLASFTGIFINPQSQNLQNAIKLAGYLAGRESVQRFAGIDGFIPVRNDIPAEDDLAELIAAGAEAKKSYTNSEFANYWLPFQQMYEDVIYQGADPYQALLGACSVMNSSNAR